MGISPPKLKLKPCLWNPLFSFEHSHRHFPPTHRDSNKICNNTPKQNANFFVFEGAANTANKTFQQVHNTPRIKNSI